MIHREERGPVAVLRLAHGKANAIDAELATALGEELETLAASDATRAVVLTARGSIFCAGVNLDRLLEGDPRYLRAFLPAFGGMLLRFLSFPRPVVAAVNGHAVAGGCILACACDYRLMASGPGTIGVPELLVGVPFPRPAVEVLRLSIPAPALRELIYTGRLLTPEQALERGIVDEVVAPERLAERALEIAERLARVPPRTFALTKRQLRAPALELLRAAPDETEPEVEAIWTDPATREVVRAYVEATLGPRRRGRTPTPTGTEDPDAGPGV